MNKAFDSNEPTLDRLDILHLDLAVLFDELVEQIGPDVEKLNLIRKIRDRVISISRHNEQSI